MFTGRLVSDRRYQSGQGYEMTRLYSGWIQPSDTRRDSKVKVVVHAGNSRGYAFAEASLWTPGGWTQIVRRPGEEMEEAPTYAAWTWTREDRPTALVNREDCEAWLEAQADAVLELAKEVL